MQTTWSRCKQLKGKLLSAKIRKAELEELKALAKTFDAALAEWLAEPVKPAGELAEKLLASGALERGRK